jgi:hypothetical protein
MKHHLLIAGTGRAGTSVLVKYLAELGLNTHIAVQGKASWDEDAHAGLEDLILHGGEELPYVVKSPWLHEFVDEVLERDDITIDGVIIPVRNLADAASSRSIRELQNVHRVHERMAEENKTWDTWGTTPGGILYSLNPLDQARLLAVGFHHLIERLTRADVPIYLLAFPRFTEDPEYLFSTLKDCLPSSIDLDAAFAAHRSVVDLDKVRVAEELSGKGMPKTARKSPEHYPALDDIDNAALRREITKIRRSFADASESLRSAKADNSTYERNIEILQQEITSNQREIEHQRNVIEGLHEAIESSQAQFKAIQSSTSWLLTSPIRWILGTRS